MHLNPGQNETTNPRQNGVPLLDLKRQHLPLKDQIEESLARVCDSGWFVLGPDVKDLEKALAEYCGARHAVGCASGSDALLLGLMAADVGPGDEVILPSFTFFATASAVTRLGARPTRYLGERRPLARDDSHAEIVYESHKCILCGACVRLSRQAGDRPDTPSDRKEGPDGGPGPR